MPGDEHKTLNRAKNHARLAIISFTMSVQTTVSHELCQGMGQIRCQCFSCPGDCKELSKKTRQSTHDSNQAGPSHG